MPGSGAIVSPIFKPAVRDIASITNAAVAVVTTTFDHGYVDGLIMRLDIPLNFGMQQVNKLKGQIVVINSTSFYIAIDTSSFDPFVIPPDQPGFNFTPAQCVPIGEIASTLDGAFRNILTPLF